MTDLLDIYSRHLELDKLNQECLWRELMKYSRGAARLYWNLQAKLKGWQVANSDPRITELMEETNNRQLGIERIRQKRNCY